MYGTITRKPELLWIVVEHNGRIREECSQLLRMLKITSLCQGRMVQSMAEHNAAVAVSQAWGSETGFVSSIRFRS